MNGHGVGGAKVSVSDITDIVQHDSPLTSTTPAPFWFRDCEDVHQTHIAGELHMFLMADTEWEALEIASAGFCGHAGVWNIDGLLSWSTQQHRQWRTTRDLENTAMKQARDTPALHQQALF